MVAIADESILNVHSLAKSGDEYQLVIDDHYAFKVDGIVVFKHNNGDEVLGIINEVERVNEHKLLYIELNPNQKANLNKEQIKEIMLWGTL